MDRPPFEVNRRSKPAVGSAAGTACRSVPARASLGVRGHKEIAQIDRDGSVGLEVICGVEFCGPAIAGTASRKIGPFANCTRHERSEEKPHSHAERPPLTIREQPVITPRLSFSVRYRASASSFGGFRSASRISVNALNGCAPLNNFTAFNFDGSLGSG